MKVWLGTRSYLMEAVAILIATAALIISMARPSGEYSEPPVIFDRVDVVTPEVSAGNTVQVIIYREKLRGDCPVRSERFATLASDPTVQHELIGWVWDGGPVSDGIEPLAYEYLLPPDIAPGEYNLDVFLTYFCPENTHVIRQPPATFIVSE